MLHSDPLFLFDCTKYGLGIVLNSFPFLRTNKIHHRKREMKEIELTSEGRGKIAIGDEITDEELLIRGPVVCPEPDDVGVLDSADGLDLSHELLVPLLATLSQPPHGHWDPISEDDLVDDPQLAFPQHVG